MSIRRRAAGVALALTLAGSAAAVITAAVPASADTGGNAGLQYCRSLAAGYPFNITGPCTSYFQSHDFAGVAASNALFCREEYVPAGQFASVGQCIQYFNQALGG